MESDLGILATIAAVSPFIGLFGTVWGIIDAFRGIGATGNASLATVAPGISEALVATAIGLVAAIPALMAYNFFQGQLKRVADRAGRLRAGIHQPVGTQLHLKVADCRHELCPPSPRVLAAPAQAPPPGPEVHGGQAGGGAARPGRPGAAGLAHGAGRPQAARGAPGRRPRAGAAGPAAASTLEVLGQRDPAAACARAMELLPNTADRGSRGWVPHRIWDPLAPLVSLRLGVALLALLGQPEDARYPLACGAALFNSALFHECHDALEPLWLEGRGRAEGRAAGPDPAGRWLPSHAAAQRRRDDQPLGGRPAGARTARRARWPRPGAPSRCAGAAAAAAERMAWLERYDGAMELDPLWALARPTWELT